MSKITTNTNGSYIPKWVQAACSNPKARTQEQCRARTGITKAVLIQPCSQRADPHSVTSQAAHALAVTQPSVPRDTKGMSIRSFSKAV